MANVLVMTDTVACIPPELAEELNMEILPAAIPGIRTITAWGLPRFSHKENGTVPFKLIPVSFGKGLVLGLRNEEQNDESQQEDTAHGQAGVSHRLVVALFRREDVGGEQSEQRRPQGRHVASDVIAERRARAPQSRGEQLGEVDRVAAEERQGHETEQEVHGVNLPLLIQEEEHAGDNDPPE